MDRKDPAPAADAHAADAEQTRRVEEARIPVVEEEVTIGKRVRETGRVRVNTRVAETEQLLRETLAQERVEVERIALDRVVDEPPKAYTEGDVLIVPVVEERLVVQRQWVVTEEVRITRRRTEEEVEIPVTTSRTEVDIERE